MTQITIDAALSSQLQRLGQVAELRDPSGKVVGKFVPHIDLSTWEAVTPEPTEEELDAIEQANDWRPFEEVMDHLRGLERQ
jgi:hypothetical protein